MTGEGKTSSVLFYGFSIQQSVFPKKQVEKMSRKLYNNRDKTRRVVLWLVAFIQK